MANNQPVDGDEIDLFDVIDTLWDGRLILAGFVVVAMSLGAVFLALNKPEYVTQARYEINPAPPFLKQTEIYADISRTFFNANTFARWKDGRPGTSLNIDLIDPKKIIDGADFAWPVKERLVSFENTQIKIKSNDTELIFEVLDYFEFVGLRLSERYVAEGKRERSRLHKLEKRLLLMMDSKVGDQSFESVAKLGRYLDNAVATEQTMIISRPLPPRKIGISTAVILSVAIALGGASGAVVLLARKAYRARKLRMSALKT